MHQRAQERRAEAEQIRTAWNAAMEMLWVNNQPEAARLEIIMPFLENRITLPNYHDLMARIGEDIGAWTEMHAMPAAAPPPVSDLHRLALDGQNVHTGPVAKQTNTGTDLLTGVSVPTDQNTLTEIRSAWCEKPPAIFRRVIKDVTTWYNRKMCREEGDQLYKRTLDGLWATVRKSPFKADLTQRLWEEAEESLGMCCEGHISRLCNVLVGYDDAFKPQVSLGEMLQQRMAAIAAEDIDTLLKVERAWFAMDEMGVPMEERNAWIEAM